MTRRFTTRVAALVAAASIPFAVTPSAQANAEKCSAGQGFWDQSWAQICLNVHSVGVKINRVEVSFLSWPTNLWFDYNVKMDTAAGTYVRRFPDESIWWSFKTPSDYRWSTVVICDHWVNTSVQSQAVKNPCGTWHSTDKIYATAWAKNRQGQLWKYLRTDNIEVHN